MYAVGRRRQLELPRCGVAEKNSRSSQKFSFQTYYSSKENK